MVAELRPAAQFVNRFSAMFGSHSCNRTTHFAFSVNYILFPRCILVSAYVSTPPLSDITTVVAKPDFIREPGVCIPHSCGMSGACAGSFRMKYTFSLFFLLRDRGRPALQKSKLRPLQNSYTQKERGGCFNPVLFPLDAHKSDLTTALWRDLQKPDSPSSPFSELLSNPTHMLSASSDSNILLHSNIKLNANPRIHICEHQLWINTDSDFELSEITSLQRMDLRSGTDSHNNYYVLIDLMWIDSPSSIDSPHGGRIPLLETDLPHGVGRPARRARQLRGIDYVRPRHRLYRLKYYFPIDPDVRTAGRVVFERVSIVCVSIRLSGRGIDPSHEYGPARLVPYHTLTECKREVAAVAVHIVQPWPTPPPSPHFLLHHPAPLPITPLPLHQIFHSYSRGVGDCTSPLAFERARGAPSRTGRKDFLHTDVLLISLGRGGGGGLEENGT
ncbi:hypothetical protein EVAR_6077_1 [Eumeta japonica]|uniref:Uncharacterized protein n=1 Tax=Eumeta variegata TaxID=151549 RepID=A0A4C1TE46_EUMVA|nr:hypothetical protein EVAR_6077_1 [Eumeta japonica]